MAWTVCFELLVSEPMSPKQMAVHYLYMANKVFVILILYHVPITSSVSVPDLDVLSAHVVELR